jgi:hypothetical protein
MNDPEWLLGRSQSESLVLRWREENDRQFCVLPFYEGNRVEQGRECYMLWARALSDGCFYPVPTRWYTLDLVQDQRGHFDVYQWVCQVFTCTPANIRMELNIQPPLKHPDPDVCALSVVPGRDIITPEPVQRSSGTEERQYTVFYPDVSLFCDMPCPASQRNGGGDEPRPVYERPREGYYAPVEICARSQEVLGLRSVSTPLWTAWRA